MMRPQILGVTGLLLMPLLACAQGFKANYDESLVPKYELPDPLVLLSGKRVTDVKTWKRLRRPEILKLFQDHVYGRAPARPTTGGT